MNSVVCVCIIFRDIIFRDEVFGEGYLRDDYLDSFVYFYRFSLLCFFCTFNTSKCEIHII